MGRTVIGMDLDRSYAQISYYNERSLEPETLSAQENQNRCQIPAPPDLFPLIEGNVELGLTTLANFIKRCIQGIRPAVEPEESCIMVTMREVTAQWAEALKEACQMAGFARENVFLQTHRESFCCYTLHQRKDVWLHKVALFEYEDEKIFSYVMDIDYRTKPALVSAEPGPEAVIRRNGEEDDAWDKLRDQAFLALIQETFQGEPYSAAFLIGDRFDKSWAVESVQMLCRRRHVFQGQNLYTKGACYAAMQRMGIGKKLDHYLYYSEDTVEKNLSMQMEIRGKAGDYQLISAGVNWFEAEHTCEFLISGTNKVVIYAKSIHGGGLESYSIELKGLPKSEDRTRRLMLKLKFIARGRCRATVRDLGFGEFYPSTGSVWESVLEV